MRVFFAALNLRTVFEGLPARDAVVYKERGFPFPTLSCALQCPFENFATISFGFVYLGMAIFAIKLGTPI